MWKNFKLKKTLFGIPSVFTAVLTLFITYIYIFSFLPDFLKTVKLQLLIVCYLAFYNYWTIFGSITNFLSNYDTLVTICYTSSKSWLPTS